VKHGGGGGPTPRVRSAAGARATPAQGSTDRDSCMGGGVNGAGAVGGGVYATRPNHTRGCCRTTRSVNASSGDQMWVTRCSPC